MSHFEKSTILVSKISKKLGISTAYQDKRKTGNRERWELISKRLDDQDASVMDIGSNLGEFTAGAARLGKIAIGFEPQDKLVARARRKHGSIPGIGFVCYGLTPDNVDLLPQFDVVFCLSVYHYWIDIYGEDVAWEMVAVLLSKANRKFFFEPASIYKRYGNKKLDFVELDEESIKTYILGKLTPLLKPEQRIDYLGITPCLGRETFRSLYLVS